MGGALQAIARSSPARGARMEGKGGENKEEQRVRKEGMCWGGGVGTELLHLIHMMGLSVYQHMQHKER